MILQLHAVVQPQAPTLPFFVSLNGFDKKLLGFLRKTNTIASNTITDVSIDGWRITFSHSCSDNL